jgi:hypothetical protein
MRLRLENRGGLGKQGAWRKERPRTTEKPSEGGGGFVITLEVRAEQKKEKTKKGSKARFERKGE